jgi:hypothetical protein
MSGTFTGKSLADGQLPNSKGTLYTVPGSTVAYVKQINVFNTNTTAETVTIYIKPGATSRSVRQMVLQPNETGTVDGPFILPAAALIEGVTTTASKVDYVITGVEES